MPSKLWERIKLSEDYARALEQIDERLLYWPKYLQHKCKQRMTRLAQVALRSRRIAKEDERMGETIVGKMAPKVKRREATRERKALAAAKLEKQIEKELIERLRSGAYGEAPLNVEEGIWKKVLRGLERGGDAERDVDEEEEEELEDEEEYDEDEEIEYVSGDEELEEEAENDLNDLEDWIGSGASDFEGDDDEEDSSDEESDDEDVAPTKKGSAVDPKKRKRDAPAPKPRKRMSPRFLAGIRTETNFYQVEQESRSSTSNKPHFLLRRSSPSKLAPTNQKNTSFPAATLLYLYSVFLCFVFGRKRVFFSCSNVHNGSYHKSSGTSYTFTEYDSRVLLSVWHVATVPSESF